MIINSNDDNNNNSYYSFSGDVPHTTHYQIHCMIFTETLLDCGDYSLTIYTFVCA